MIAAPRGGFSPAKYLLAAGVLPGLLIVEPGDGGTDVEERRVAAATAGVICCSGVMSSSDPDAAPVRRDDQIAVARMDEDVVDARRSADCS